jgi:hypothetical protein
MKVGMRQEQGVGKEEVETQAGIKNIYIKD